VGVAVGASSSKSATATSPLLATFGINDSVLELLDSSELLSLLGRFLMTAALFQLLS
jgi:hypothetical protein